MPPQENRRKDTRSDLDWPISLWHPGSKSFYNGESKNVSKGGALLTIPMTNPICPVCVGQKVEINFPRNATMAKQKGQYARIKSGIIKRVKREGLQIVVAIEFI